MKFTLGTGYYKDDGFTTGFWIPGVRRYCRPRPESIVSITLNGLDFPWHGIGISQASLTGNLGHVGELLNGKDRDFCGWSGAVLALAMIAYNNETDLIYLESDTLAFGPWVEQIYADMGDGEMVFGGKMEASPFMACAQGLFLIRHRFIPTFVMTYIAMGSDARKFEGKSDNLPEDKFHRLREAMPDKIKTLSFGVDRMRPIPYDAPVFYCQQIKPEEMEILKAKGLL